MTKEVMYNNEVFGRTYHPCVISTDNIPLPDDLDELIHAMAERKHDIWALNRIHEGWTYGKERNNDLKIHPDLVPFGQLPESEKECDLVESIDTIKFIYSMGYTITRKVNDK